MVQAFPPRHPMITARTHLKLITDQDWLEFLSMYQEPEVFRYIPKLERRSEAEYQHFFNSRLQWVQSGQGYYWAARSIEDGKLIGALNLYPYHKPGMIHLGCQIRRQYWGLGYATEIMAAGRDFGIFQLGLPIIYAFVDINHLASIHLLEKLKFVQSSIEKSNTGSLTAVYQYIYPGD
ncbi:MAG: GNAT family N-acetyltransferase [Bacteroidota bacterium]